MSYHTGTSFLRLNLSQTDLSHLDITLFLTRYVFFSSGGEGGYFSSSVSSVTVTHFNTDHCFTQRRFSPSATGRLKNKTPVVNTKWPSLDPWITVYC